MEKHTVTPGPSPTEMLKLTKFASRGKITLLILTTVLNVPQKDWQPSDHKEGFTTASSQTCGRAGVGNSGFCSFHLVVSLWSLVQEGDVPVPPQAVELGLLALMATVPKRDHCLPWHPARCCSQARRTSLGEPVGDVGVFMLSLHWL